jgi:hypothetical protein
MWIKKALVAVAWIAAAFVALIILIMIEDSGGLELKAFLVVGGLVLWFGISKQLDRLDKQARDRHAALLSEVKELREWAEANASYARQEVSKKLWKELRSRE